MHTTTNDWIANHRMSQLLASEVAMAHAAGHLARHLRGDGARRASARAATSARWAAEVLTGLLPRTLSRRPTKRGSRLTRWLSVAARFGDGVALLLLDLVLRAQTRRIRGALDLVAFDAHDALLRGVLPQRVDAIAQLRQARSAPATRGLEAAP